MRNLHNFLHRLRCFYLMTIVLRQNDVAVVVKQALLLIVVCTSMVPFENVM